MIYYIGFYDIMTNGKFIRKVSPAAVRKMDYIINKLESIGEAVTVLSTACPTVKSANLPNKISLSNTVQVQYFPIGNFSSKFLRSVAERFVCIWLFLYCLLHVRSSDSVIYYHAPSTDNAVRLSQRIKKYTLISEIEEIYSLVWKRSRRDIKNEQIFLRDCTEKSIVVSESLKNHLKVPAAVVSYGSYAICMKPKIKHDDGFVRLVYSGAFDKVKGGAFAALEIMPLLPLNYRLVLSGNCPPALIPELNEKINKLNAVRGKDNIYFAGLLPEQEFEHLLLSSDIALNLQNEGAFSSFLFPSKLLTYLCYNLPVVTTPGESIVTSSLSDILCITADYDPQTIAQAILSVDLNHHKDSRQCLMQIDTEFEQNLKKLLQS